MNGISARLVTIARGFLGSQNVLQNKSSRSVASTYIRGGEREVMSRQFIGSQRGLFKNRRNGQMGAYSKTSNWGGSFRVFSPLHSSIRRGSYLRVALLLWLCCGE